MFSRRRTLSWLQKAGAALRVDLLHRGLTCFSIWPSNRQHFCATCYALLPVDRASPTLQVEKKAQLLGSGLLAKGCQPNAEQFVGIFAQNRPEVWTLLWALRRRDNFEGWFSTGVQSRTLELRITFSPLVLKIKIWFVLYLCLHWKCVCLYSYGKQGGSGECRAPGQIIKEHICFQTLFLIYLTARQNHFWHSCAG